MTTTPTMQFLGRCLLHATLALAPGSRRQPEEVADHSSSAAAPFEGQEHIVLDREPAEDLLTLEGAPQTATGALDGRPRRDVLARQDDLPADGALGPCDAVE